MVVQTHQERFTEHASAMPTANAMKHGNGDTIDISLRADDDSMCVRIDNGISPHTGDSQPRADHGIGRQTLQKRADRIGAKLTITEEGTRHSLTLTYRLGSEA